MGDRIAVKEVLARVSLADIALRDVGRWDPRRSNFSRGDLWACCPFHQEKTPSFHVDVRKGLFKCFGCGVGGDVVEYVKRRQGVSFRGAIEWLAQEAGIAGVPGRPAPAVAAARRSRSHGRASGDADARRRLARARAIWRAAKPALHTPAHDYLMARGIDERPPASLRYHPRLWRSREHGEGPAMVAVMAGPEGQFAGVHRTWLARADDGSWRKAGGEGVKKMLGVARGACVRLTPAAECIHIAEGIETAMAVLQALRRQGEDRPAVWAALSLGNMGRVWLPDTCREVVLVADNDTKDWRAARRAMRDAARMHAARGRIVRIVWPPRGMDFLDWINASAFHATAETAAG